MDKNKPPTAKFKCQLSHQLSLALFEELIRKHSNEGDTVLDTFLGSGTTALASRHTKRKFKGCEISAEYFDKIMKLVSDDPM